MLIFATKNLYFLLFGCLLHCMHKTIVSLQDTFIWYGCTNWLIRNITQYNVCGNAFCLGKSWCLPCAPGKFSHQFLGYFIILALCLVLGRFNLLYEKYLEFSLLICHKSLSLAYQAIFSFPFFLCRWKKLLI